MKSNTSLKTIGTQTVNGLRQSQRIQLFHPAKSAPFSINMLQQHPHILSDAKFSALLNVIVNHNSKHHSQSFGAHNKSENFRNQFIYSSLKRIAQSPKLLAEQLLNKLFDWYQTNSDAEIRIDPILSHKIDNDRQALAVREQFQSDLPYQIDSYRRRVIPNLIDPQQKKLQPIKLMNKEQTPTMLRCFKNVWVNRERECRQEREDMEVVWKQKEHKFSQNRLRYQTAKDFYGWKNKPQDFVPKKVPFFNKTQGKDFFKQFKDNHEAIKQLRIRTTMGLRNRNKEADERVNPILSSIDGLGLLASPLEKKTKKGKQK